mgnify:FL=1|jgi:hypothetical protein
MNKSDCYMAKVYIPSDLAHKIFELAGGNDVMSLGPGILKACYMATSHDCRINSHELPA